ncbi:MULTISPECIES: TonB-dependent receptor [Idiomarina]|uniref:TonB-dependent receptor n=1 Tax=Idiomarina TaxID=135575 RepID=UPI000C55E68B|nr:MULTISPECIES: TonB-dependent receptor [Idiomarina]MBP57658.1 TonB-dependent receptor [Idiomarina sp.]HAS15464.1 TonB-dependent receptor [Idiomarina abyssalis]
MIKRSYLAWLIAVSCGASPLLMAQEAQDKTNDKKVEEKPIEEVLTIGYGDSIKRAVKQQRESGGIINVLKKDDMGKLQDDSVSDALQRIPGLSVERDQGEGRFIRIRGLAPDLNSVSYNGTSLAAPEAGRRAVALDVIPSDLLESIVVNKTLTPDISAGSLGGNIELQSMTAFDREGSFYSVSTDIGYNQQASETNPKVSGVISNTFDVGDKADSFGIAFAGSYQDRSFTTDNVETGGNWDLDEPGLEEFEQRAYSVTRERTGLALNLDYRPSDASEFYLRSLYSEFADTEVRQGIVTEFSGPVAKETFTGGEVVRELKDRKETQEITAFVLGTKQKLGDWAVKLEAGTSKASEDQPFAIGGAKFTQEFDDGLGFSGLKRLKLIAPDNAYQASEYEIDEVEVSDAYTEETEKNIKLDLAYDWLQPGYQVTFKGGIKLSQREKSAREDIFILEDFADVGVTALTLADYETESKVEYGLDDFGPGISAAQLWQMIDAFNLQEFRDDVESQIASYGIDEDISAGYLMADMGFGNWQVIAGARYEHETREGRGTRYDDEQETFSPEVNDFSDANWLPSVVTRYDLSEDTIVRMAYSTGLVRPSFEQVRPSYYLENDDGDLKSEFGNPDLEPLTAQNFDFGIEHYNKALGVISAMVFYKDIENFVYEADVAGRPGYEGFDEAITYINGDDAYVYGLEVNFVHHISGFDNWLDNFLINTNLTFTDSEATVDWMADDQLQSRDIPLPSQSDTTANFALGYEIYDVSLRLAANYKSEYLAELGDVEDSRYDIYEDDNLTVDFSAKWLINEHLSISFAANNITDEPFYVYTGQPQYNAQYESYGRSFTLGVQLINW